MGVLSACTFVPPPPAYFPDRSSIQPGETIVVKGNENVYTVAHEHNVSMRELIVLNDLKPPFEIRSGQKLVLPAGGSSFSGDMAPPDSSPLEPVEKKDLSPIVPAAVSSEPLEAPEAPPPETNLKPKAQPTTQAADMQVLNGPLPTPKQTATTMAAQASADEGTVDVSTTMKWPLQGPILSSFGPKGSGLNNDGINIGAPKGAPVVAAAPGTVAYAGNDMKGFGNLVLIKHQGDMVTAYAHLDRVLVKKDSIVAQGDMIGTVGKTGNVASPQLHFEVRLNNQPVDPAQVIKGEM